MQKFPPRKIQFCLRALLLLVVFGGLLFSCGEGIRLLPFPAGEALPAAGREWKTERGNDYQKNIHRFEHQQGSYQAKPHRHHPHYWAGKAQAL